MFNGVSPDFDEVLEGRKRAIQYILKHPKETIINVIKVHKIFWLCENEDVDNYGTGLIRQLQRIVSFKLIAMLGIIGFIISRKYWRYSLWLFMYILSYNLVIDFLYYAPRYRFPVEPFLVMFSGYTLIIIFKWIQRFSTTAFSSRSIH